MTVRGSCDPPAEPPRQICLSPLTGLPGGKSARYAFLLTDGKLTSAKMLLAPAKPVLRIIIRGKTPPDHPLCIAYELSYLSGD